MAALTLDDLYDDIFFIIARHLSPAQALCLCRATCRLYRLRDAMIRRTRLPSSVEAVIEALSDGYASGWRAVGGPWSLAPVLRRLSAPVAQMLLRDLLETNHHVLLDIRSFVLRALPVHAAPASVVVGVAVAALGQVAKQYTPDRWQTALPPLRTSPHAALRSLADAITNFVQLDGPSTVLLLAHLVQEEGWPLTPYVNTAIRAPGRGLDPETQLLALGDVFGSAGLKAVMAREPEAYISLHDMAKRVASSLLTTSLSVLSAVNRSPVPPERLPAAVAALRDVGLYQDSWEQRLYAAQRAMKIINDNAVALFRWMPRPIRQRGIATSDDIFIATAAAVISACGDITLRDFCDLIAGDLSLRSTQLLATQLLGYQRQYNSMHYLCSMRVITWQRKDSSCWQPHIIQLHVCDDRRLLMAIVRSHHAKALAAVARTLGPRIFAAAMLGRGRDSGGVVLAVRVLRAKCQPLLRAMLEGGVTLTHLRRFAQPALTRYLGRCWLE